MQVTETLAEGLKHEFRVVVPVAELEAKIDSRLEELKDRPGKVPVAHLKRVYGRSVMAESIEAAVQEANAKIVSDNGFKLAMDPKVTLPSDENAVKDVIEGKADLSYSVAMEVLPTIELADFKGIELTRPVAEVSEADRPFSAKAEGSKAEKGDKVTVSFTGTLDGKPFEGGTADDIGVEIGAGAFIPGFEEQLIGMAVGETRTVTVTFPTNYLAENLAGREAVFEVTAKSLEAPGSVTIDDAFAKTLGLESLAKLRDAVKDRIAQEHNAATRRKVKRALLDALDERHNFELPPTMVEEEFNNIWRSLMADLQQQGKTLADEETDEEKAKADYRKIAERRVRLGLVLAEIGEKNNIKVTDEEVTRAVVERARQFPGQEQQVWDYYRKNPQALATLRAPIFEEKVVDFLLELAKVTDQPVSREDLYKDDDGAEASA
jgi:trigger factor